MTITERSRGDIVLLETSGRLSDLHGTVDVLQEVLCLPPNKLRRVIFILAEPISISRDGFRTLALCYQHVVTNGGRVALVGSPARVQRILGQLGLRGRVPYYQTEDEAIESFRERACQPPPAAA